MKKYKKYFRIVEILIFAGLVGAICYMQYDSIERTQARERDIVRISSLNDIRAALEEYQDQNGYYPPCLYKKAGCVSLEGSEPMATVPTDPLTDGPYTFAAFGSGSACTCYHIGTSLERTASQALLVGSDAPPQPASALCTGSDADFSGLSYAPAGKLCNATAGTAQPTDSSDGETCFDLKNRK